MGTLGLGRICAKRIGRLGGFGAQSERAHLAEEEAEEIDRQSAEVVLSDELVEVHVQELEDDAAVFDVFEVVAQPADEAWAREGGVSLPTHLVAKTHRMRFARGDAASISSIHTPRRSAEAAKAWALGAQVGSQPD